MTKQFASEMTRRLPQFKRKTAGPFIGVARRTYELCPDLKFFVDLVTLSRYDQFVLEIGWSDGGEVDLRDRYQTTVNTRARKWGARLAEFWRTGASEPVWAVVPEPSAEEMKQRLEAVIRGQLDSYSPPEPPVEAVLPNVVPLVRDSVDRLVEYALPVFRRVAEERGCAWPPGSDAGK